MEEKKFLSKKKNRKEDKNIPHFSKEDNMKYSIKNKIIDQKKENTEPKEEDEEIFLKNTENDIVEEENNKSNLYKKIKKKLIIILEGAVIELGGIKKNPQIINCDEHYKIIKSMKKKLDEFRPDIVHQCLLNLFDSPLNKVGLLQVYIHTSKNVLIEINPKTRIPRTFKRFSGLFTQLLLKNEISSSDSDEILLKVINSDIKELIGKNNPIVLLSSKGRLIDIDTYTKNIEKSLKDNNNICFIIGANPKGDIDTMIKYNDDCVSLSSFDLDSNIVCSKICTSFEKVWDIL